MTIHIPNYITRAYITEANRAQGLLFLYGDTVGHDGNGGQASQARGCEGAHVIPVKWRKCYNDEDAFFSDYKYDLQVALIMRALCELPEGKPIVVFPKIGLGMNKMDVKAPRTYRALISILRGLPDVINKDSLPC